MIKRITIAFFLIPALMIPHILSAQISPTNIPAGLIIINYDRISIGQREGLEAGAFVARTDDAAANWYNPAGLSRSEKSALNAAGTAYEWSKLSLEGVKQTATGSRITTLGSYFGGVIAAPSISADEWRFGFSITKPISWSPSAINQGFESPESGGTESFSYFSELDFSQMIPAIAAGYNPGGSVQFGVSLGVSETSLRQLHSVSGRNIASSSISSATRSFSTDGESWSFIPSFGFLMDVTQNASVGLKVSAPSMKIAGSSQLTYQFSSIDVTSAEQVTFRDDKGTFVYKYPLQVDGGIAMKFTDVAIEADVRYYGSIDDYDLFTSGNQIDRVTTDSAGVPTVTGSSFNAMRNSASSVVNVAVGGHYAITAALKVHLGFHSDLSPASDKEGALFRKIDLYGGTCGLTLSGEHLSGSLGLAFSTGKSDRISVGTLPDGTPAGSQLSVTTLNLLYSISYAF